MPNPNAPQPGELVIDVTALKGFLVDLPPGAMQGMRTEQDGWADVVAEIVGNQAEHGDAAGITATDFARFQTLNEQYAQLVAYLPAVEKLVEILQESRANIDNQRQRLASAFAQSAELRAKASGGDTTLLAKYAKTRAYRSAVAEKGARTRRKNAEAAKPAGDNGKGGGTPTP